MVTITFGAGTLSQLAEQMEMVTGGWTTYIPATNVPIDAPSKTAATRGGSPPIIPAESTQKFTASYFQTLVPIFRNTQRNLSTWSV